MMAIHFNADRAYTALAECLGLDYYQIQYADLEDRRKEKRTRTATAMRDDLELPSARHGFEPFSSRFNRSSQETVMDVGVSGARPKPDVKKLKKAASETPSAPDEGESSPEEMPVEETSGRADTITGEPPIGPSSDERSARERTISTEPITPPPREEEKWWA